MSKGMMAAACAKRFTKAVPGCRDGSCLPGRLSIVWLQALARMKAKIELAQAPPPKKRFESKPPPSVTRERIKEKTANKAKKQSRQKITDY